MDRSVEESKLEERTAGATNALLPCDGLVLERLAQLFESQLETADFHCCITQLLHLDQETTLVPHIQLTDQVGSSAANVPPFLVPPFLIEIFDRESQGRLPLRRALYERSRLREYWAINVVLHELERYVLLEGFFLPPHTFDLREEAVYSVVFPELRLPSGFFQTDHTV